MTEGRSPFQVFMIFLRLGLTSFGGPVAHLGYFRDEFVTRRGWLSEPTYAQLVALCQFLPGPASSQVGMALGLSRAGYRGALAAWAGFTLPSALALTLFALGLQHYAHLLPGGALHGLKVVAVAVVAQAVWGMARTLCPDARRALIMLAAACLVLLAPTVWGQLAALLLAGASGVLLARPTAGVAHEFFVTPLGPRSGVAWLTLFITLLLGLPLLSMLFPSQALAMVDAFYRTGALVFGGGHVVLPLLQAEVVSSGWVDTQTFLTGYGATQATPGPLFTFAAFLGASMHQPPTGWAGGLLCLLAIFAPAFMVLAGTLAFWERLRQNARAQGALAGVNAAVVGLLLAALYDPVWTSAIHSLQDASLAGLAFLALMAGKQPPWRVVLGCAVLGAMLG